MTKMVRNRNKKVTYGKCLRIIQSDVVNRNMLQHEKGKFEKESLCRSSNATSRTSLQEETESDFSSISTNTYTPINEEVKNQELLKNSIEVLKIYKLLQRMKAK